MQTINISHTGTMRFFGDWFGRPMDNLHKVVNAIYDEDSDVLVMTFGNGEECIVSSPVGIISTKDSFFVKDASCVTWTWYYYGKKRIDENKLKIQYKKESANIVIRQEDGINNTPSITHINSKGFYAVEIC